MKGSESNLRAHCNGRRGKQDRAVGFCVCGVGGGVLVMVVVVEGGFSAHRPATRAGACTPHEQAQACRRRSWAPTLATTPSMTSISDLNSGSSSSTAGLAQVTEPCRRTQPARAGAHRGGWEQTMQSCCRVGWLASQSTAERACGARGPSCYSTLATGCGTTADTPCFPTANRLLYS